MRVLALSTRFLRGCSLALCLIPYSATSIAQSPAQQVVHAQRRLAREVGRVGLRKAFAAAAAPNAEILVPDPFNVPEWLNKDARYWNPKVTGDWLTLAVYLSCDQRTATTIGFWYDDETNGYFATTWVRTKLGWRWHRYFDDSEEKAPVPRLRQPKIVHASCRNADPSLLPNPAEKDIWERVGSGDHTLEWRLWNVRSEYQLGIYLWTGRSYRAIIRKGIGHDYE